MKGLQRRWLLGQLAMLCMVVCASAWSATGMARRTPAGEPPNDRVIVKWRERGIAAVQIDDLAQRTARLAAFTGLALRPVRSLGAKLDVYRLPYRVDAVGMRQTLSQLRLDPSVEFAEADAPRYITAAPNDPRFVAGSDTFGNWRGQWYLQSPSADTPAAIDAVNAWDTTQGNDIVVAIIDTGVSLDHPDLAGQLLSGRDFVCHDSANIACSTTGTTLTTLTANDGDGWDADATDPGDWISGADLARSDNFFAGCGDGDNHDEPFDSSWHGTRVAGVIGALTNNSVGMAAVAPRVKLLPVRAIGKCRGYTSDLVAAMYWAGGISNSALGSVTPSSSAARVINLSLGSRDACSQAEQTAIDELLAARIVVVAAAGNDGGPIGSPANCAGVLSVAGLRHIGTKVGYSNVSSTAASIAIAAPAGNCVNISAQDPCLYSIETLTNEGITTPVASNGQTSYTYAQFVSGYTGNRLNVGNVGTSFAAPMVSAVAAQMLAVNDELYADEVIQRMQLGATAFPVPATTPTGGTCHIASLNKDSSGNYTDLQNSDCQCTTATCGAGMLNASAAISQALRPISVFSSSRTSASVGQTVRLDGSLSLAAPGHTLVAYQWSSNPSISISNANSVEAEFLFPALRPITISLTVTDDAGRQDTSSLTVESTFTSDESGGGAFGLELLALGLLLCLRYSRN